MKRDSLAWRGYLGRAIIGVEANRPAGPRRLAAAGHLEQSDTKVVHPAKNPHAWSSLPFPGDR